MNFIIASSKNSLPKRELLFSCPNRESSYIAATKVADMCYAALPTGEVYQKRLDQELQQMRQTEAAYYFLILKEIQALSPDGIIMHGNAAGSLISWLLGFCAVNPLDADLIKHHIDSPIEFVWGMPEQSKIPDFSIAIDPQIEPLICDRLRAHYGMAAAENEHYCKISMVDKLMYIRKCGTYAEILYDVAIKRATEIKKCRNEGIITESGYEESIDLIEEMQTINNCDLPTLIRLYAYSLGEFEGSRLVENLQDPDFFTTREELYAKLLTYGISKSDALDIVKHGVWSDGERRKKYIALLEEHHIPLPVINHFERVRHLWDASSIYGRIGPYLSRDA